MLTDHKILETDVAAGGVAAAPDKLSGTAAENKALFDRLVRETVARRLNGLIDEIVTELAGKMPAPPFMGVPGQYLRIGEEGVEWGVPGGSGDMIAAVYDADGDGIVDRAAVADYADGGAASAERLAAPVELRICDSAGNEGEALRFDGTQDAQLRLPGVIRAHLIGDVSGSVTGSAGSCSGNAETASRLRSPRTLTVRDSSGVYCGGEVSFDGSGNVELRLPESLSLLRIVAGSALAGSAYPEEPVEGQLFFRTEEA